MTVTGPGVRIPLSPQPQSKSRDSGILFFQPTIQSNLFELDGGLKKKKFHQEFALGLHGTLFR
ncbi:MAG: hypothetical protein Q4F57_01520, partial [Weeksellaceae bacterium]|nr:hypothetical protein [Weeksellaceae bacterium]